MFCYTNQVSRVGGLLNPLLMVNHNSANIKRKIRLYYLEITVYRFFFFFFHDTDVYGFLIANLYNKIKSILLKLFLYEMRKTQNPFMCRVIKYLRYYYSENFSYLSLPQHKYERTCCVFKLEYVSLL